MHINTNLISRSILILFVNNNYRITIRQGTKRQLKNTFHFHICHLNVLYFPRIWIKWLSYVRDHVGALVHVEMRLVLGQYCFRVMTVHHMSLTVHHGPLTDHHGSLTVPHMPLTVQHWTLTVHYRQLTVHHGLSTVSIFLLNGQHGPLTVHNRKLTINYKPFTVHR